MITSNEKQMEMQEKFPGKAKMAESVTREARESEEAFISSE